MVKRINSKNWGLILQKKKKKAKPERTNESKKLCFHFHSSIPPRNSFLGHPSSGVCVGGKERLLTMGMRTNETNLSPSVKTISPTRPRPRASTRDSRKGNSDTTSSPKLDVVAIEPPKACRGA